VPPADMFHRSHAITVSSQAFLSLPDHAIPYFSKARGYHKR